MIFRDDDISALTNVDQLRRVHSLFVQHEVTHTIAVIADGLDRAEDLIKFIRGAQFLDVQLHCLTHLDLTEHHDLVECHLMQARGMLRQCLGVTPTVLYPPWNKADDFLRQAAARQGMRVSTAKISLSQYVRCDGDVAEEVINFHYWADGDVALLGAALALHRQRLTGAGRLA